MCVVEKGGFLSCRRVLVAVGFFTNFNFLTIRTSLSVAIVAMVNTTYLRELDTVNVTNERSNSSRLCDQRQLCETTDNTTHFDDDLADANVSIQQ